MERQPFRPVVCVSFHPTRKASCHVAAAQRAPPLAIGRALDPQAASSRRAAVGRTYRSEELFLQCESVVAAIRAGLTMESALEPKPPRTDRVLSIGCDLCPFDDLAAVSAGQQWDQEGACQCPAIAIACPTGRCKKRSITVLCPITGVCMRIQWTDRDQNEVMRPRSGGDVPKWNGNYISQKTL
jgi:hypothetical protein